MNATTPASSSARTLSCPNLVSQAQISSCWCSYSLLQQDNSYDTWCIVLTVTSFSHTFGCGERSAAPHRVHRAPVSYLLPSKPVNLYTTSKCICLLSSPTGQATTTSRKWNWLNNSHEMTPPRASWPVIWWAQYNGNNANLYWVKQKKVVSGSTNLENCKNGKVSD